MSSVTITLTGICSGGNHLTLESTGDATGTVQMVLADLLDVPTPQQRKAFVEVLVYLVKLGKTQNQARIALQAGVTITV